MTAAVEKLCPLSMGIVYPLRIFLAAETRFRVHNNQLAKSVERKEVMWLVLNKAFRAERARGVQHQLKELHQDRKVESLTLAPRERKLRKTCLNNANSKHTSVI